MAYPLDHTYYGTWNVSEGAFQFTEKGKQAIVDCITDPQNQNLYNIDIISECNAVSKIPNPCNPGKARQLQGFSHIDRQLLAELYNQTLVLVTPAPSSSDPKSDPLVIGLGAGAGALVLVVVGVFWYNSRKPRSQPAILELL